MATKKKEQDQLVVRVPMELFEKQRKREKASLVGQWLRPHLLMQGTRAPSLVWGDSTCLGAAEPVGNNYGRPCASSLCSATREASEMRSPNTVAATRESPGTAKTK